ncbi:MAG TPA: BPL-N domain-containing protein [Bdellovibrionales bacterium]|nr:BPL-N domain-containing protein [Bdellovibrionales bacterium]
MQRVNSFGIAFALSILFAASAILPSVSQATPVKAKTKKIIVYRGIGGCNSCAAAAAKAVRVLGLPVDYVSASEVTPEIFEGAVMWVQPAGNAISAAKALGKERMALIRDFVKQGGGYLGFCAGAFLADTTVDDDGKVVGIGLLPFSTADYEVNDTDNIDMVWMNWQGKRRHVFFNGGATFLIGDSKPVVDVIATYGKDRLPGAIHMTFGSGHVVLSGAHPESPQTWKDNNGLTDEDGSDLDLAGQLAEIAAGK